MTAVEILLKIKALFDRKGSDEAKEAVDGVGQANVFLDAEGLEYISSGGLRVLLQLLPG